MRRSGLVAIACALLPWAAGAEVLVPPAGAGLLGVSGGWRYVPQWFLATDAKKLGQGELRPSFGSPQVLVPFGYRIDDHWGVGISFAYGHETMRFTSGSSLGLSTLALELSVERRFNPGWDRLELYASAGIGQYLSAVSIQPADGPRVNTEANTQGFNAALGVRYALTQHFGLVLEDRFVWAGVGVDGFGRPLVGGNTLSLGMFYVWRQQQPSRPW